MLTPDFLLRISEPAENIAEQLHIDIINRIVERMMIRIGRGEDYLLTQTDRWQILVLQDAGYLLEDIQKEIAKKTKLQEQEIKDAMISSGITAIDYDNAIYEAAGLSPLPLMQSPYLMRLMERNYRKTVNTWKNFTGTFAKESQRLFRNQCDKAYHLVSSGAISYTEAVRLAVNEVVKEGVQIEYPSGRKMSIEAATLMCVRTGISQATGQIQLARMKEMGVNTVLVSSHLSARPSHAEWQGKVYAVDWDTLDIYESKK